MATGSSQQSKRRFWTPSILRRDVLALIASLFAVIAVTLGVLKLVSHQRNGLCDASSKDYYLWTYTPTALFTIIAAIWNQAEYRAKQMQPWRSMAQGDQAATESVLLDYISQWNVIVLFKALKRKQVVVAAAVSTSLLLQLLIVLSTGLFTLDQIEVTQPNTTLAVKDHFLHDGSLFKPNQVDARPAALVLAYAETNLQQPSGSTWKEVYQQFTSPEELGPGVHAITANVDVLSSSMECEVAQLRIVMKAELNFGLGPALQFSSVAFNHATQTSSHQLAIRATPAANSTTAGVIAVSASPVPMPSTTLNIPYADSVYSDGCGNVTLARGASTSAMEFIECSHVKGSEQAKRLLYWTGIPTNLASGGNFSAMICKPEYFLRKQSVLAHRSAAVEIVNPTSSACSKIENFDPWQLFGAFQESVSLTSNLVNFGTNVASELYTAWLMSSATELQGRIPFDQPDSATIMPIFQRAWSVFAAQTFNLYFRQSEVAPMEGSVVSLEERLILRGASIWLAISCLILCFGLSLTMAFNESNELVPRDPSSILGLAAILSSSGQLMHELSRCGTATADQLEGVLSGHKFRTSPVKPFGFDACADSFGIIVNHEVRKNDYSAHWRQHATSSEITWYQPSSTSFMYKLGLLVLLIVSIVALELLLHESQLHDGLCEVESPESYQHYAWTFVPTLFMVVLGWIIAMQHSDAKVFGPYSTLSSRPKKAAATIARRPFSDIAILKSMQHVETFLIVSTISIFVSSFLAIVVSGLLSAVPTTTQTAVTMRQNDSFPESGYLATVGYLQTDLVLNGGLSYPSFTYGTLAISSPSGQLPNNGTLEILLPAVRGRINCTLVPPDRIVNVPTLNSASVAMFSTPASSTTTAARVTESPRIVQLRFSDGWNSCLNSAPGPVLSYSPGSKSNSTTSSFDTAMLKVPKHGYFGGMVNLKSIWTRFDNVTYNSKVSCPQAVGAFGQTVNGEIKDLSLVTCKPFAEKVMAKVTFQLPSMKIETAPLVDESTAVALVIDFEDYGNPLTPITETSGLSPSSTNTSNLFDPFMSTLVYGSYGTPADELSGVANQDRLLEAMNRQYGLSFAQILNAWRTPDTGSERAFLNGTLTTPGPYRLVQSAISTHILTGLLGFILITALVTMFTMKSRRVLPKNPCSVGAVASLLADSDLLAMMPQGSNKMSDKELLSLCDGYLFSMGWWAGKEGEVGTRRFGIDFGIGGPSE